MAPQREERRIPQLQYLLLKLVAWPLRLTKADFGESRQREVGRKPRKRRLGFFRSPSPVNALGRQNAEPEPGQLGVSGLARLSCFLCSPGPVRLETGTRSP